MFIVLVLGKIFLFEVAKGREGMRMGSSFYSLSDTYKACLPPVVYYHPVTTLQTKLYFIYFIDEERTCNLSVAGLKFGPVSKYHAFCIIPILQMKKWKQISMLR